MQKQVFYLVVLISIVFTSALYSKSGNPRIVIQNGHVSSVSSLAYSPDGTILVSGSGQGIIKIWSGKVMLVHSYRAHEGPVNTLAYSIDGKSFISGSGNSNKKTWALSLWSKAGRLIRRVSGFRFGPVSSLACSPDGKLIIAGFYRGSIVVFSRRLKKLKTIQAHDSRVTGLSFNPGGKIIASSSYNKQVKTWSTQGKLLRSFDDHSDYVKGVAFTQDGKYLVSAGQGSIIVRNTYNWNIMYKVKKDVHYSTCMTVSPDSRYILTGNYYGAVKIWSVDGRFLRTSQHLSGKGRAWGNAGAEINCVEYNPLGNSFASGVSMSGNRKKVVGLKIWKSDSLLQKALITRTRQIAAAAFSPDGKRIVSCSEGKNVKIWNTDGRLAAVLKGHIRNVESAAFSPDGRYIISAGAGGDNSIKIWNKQGRLIRTVRAPRGRGLYLSGRTMALDPRGRLIAAGTMQGAVILFNYHGKIVKVIRRVPFKGRLYLQPSIYRLAFSPGGRRFIVSYSNGVLRLFSRKGRLFKSIRAYKKEYMGAVIAFNPKKKTFASGSWSTGIIKIWFYNGKLLRIFRRRLGSVHSLAFSPNGKILAASVSNKANSIHKLVFFTVNGRIIKTRFPHTGAINSICFSPDGKYFVSGSRDSRIVVTNMKNGRSMSLISAGKDWLMYTKDGYFDGSPEGGKMVAMVSGLSSSPGGLKAYGIDQFAVQKNRPDIILGRMGLGTRAQVKHYYMQYVKRLARFGYLPNGISRRDFYGRIYRRSAWKDRAVLNRSYRYRWGRYFIRKKHTFIERYRLFSIPSFTRYTERRLRSGINIPEARIVSRISRGTFLHLKLRFKDRRYKLLSYNVYVNDVPVYPGSGKRFSRQKTRSAFGRRGRDNTISETVELSSGLNKIEVSCFNEKGIESYRDQTWASCKKKGRGSLYFLGFGVSNYKSKKIRNLVFAHKDVGDLEDIFYKMRRKYMKVYSKTIINEHCTVNAVKKAKAFLANAKVDDTVVLFISGHGLHDKDKAATYYFLTHESDLGKLRSTAANFDLIEGVLHGIKPRKKFFLMDTCQSGDVDDIVIKKVLVSSGSRGMRARTVRKLKGVGRISRTKGRSWLLTRGCFIYMDLFRRSGAVVFSSSRGGELSYEPLRYSEKGNGYFTGAVLKALGSVIADRNSDGIISTDEIRRFVIALVSKKTKGLQNPVVDRDNIYIKFGFPRTK